MRTGFRVVRLTAGPVGPLSFALSPGQCLMVRGRSGVGKSLLLRALADLDPAVGQVFVDGDERLSMEAPIWRRLVGLVPAEPGWWDERLGAHFDDWPQARAQFAELLLPDFGPDRRLATLSTGERQRLALVRALTVRPRVLLLDEITSALDEDSRRAVETRLRVFLDQGGMAVWVSHDGAQTARMASLVLDLPDGSIRPCP